MTAIAARTTAPRGRPRPSHPPDSKPATRTASLTTRRRASKLEQALRAAAGSSAHVFRRKAFPAIALSLATSAPSLRAAGLLTLGKLGAWICAFDDLADDLSIDDADLAQRIEQYDELSDGRLCPELAFDPAAQMFVDILAALREAPLSLELWPLFRSQLAISCHAMEWERGAMSDIHQGRPPDLRVYLEHAVDSLCFSVAFTAAAMLLGEPGLLRCLAQFAAAERHASMLVRIANDVATWPREATERTANALAFAPPHR